jgi:hypothetical protein
MHLADVTEHALPDRGQEQRFDAHLGLLGQAIGVLVNNAGIFFTKP